MTVGSPKLKIKFKDKFPVSRIRSHRQYPTLLKSRVLRISRRYTPRGALLITLDFSVLGRWINKFRQYRFTNKPCPSLPRFTLPCTKLVVSLTSHLTTPEGQRNQSWSPSMWDGLSGVLPYVTTLLIKIHNGTFQTFQSVYRIFTALMVQDIDILSLCIRETTKDIDAMDGIHMVWRFKCSISKCDISFHSGPVTSSPIGPTCRNLYPTVSSR